MRRQLPAVLRKTLERFTEHAKLVCLQNTDEFTFRAFFLAEFKKQFKKAKCHTEWRKYDLLICRGSQRFIIEFKFYVTRRAYDIDCRPARRKGGPSDKNEGEFRACIDRLRAAKGMGLAGRCLVLAYERPREDETGRSFAQSYDDVAGKYGVPLVTTVECSCECPLICKLIEID
jgi:hypothetical protein